MGTNTQAALAFEQEELEAARLSYRVLERAGRIHGREPAAAALFGGFDNDALPTAAAGRRRLAVSLRLGACGDDRHKTRDADLSPLLEHEIETVRADERLIEDERYFWLRRSRVFRDDDSSDGVGGHAGELHLVVA